MIKDSIEYYKIQSGDSDAFTNLKIYLLIQNFLKSISFRISLGRPSSSIKQFNQILNVIITLVSIYGVIYYIYPIYFVTYTKEDFQNNPDILTPDILDEYDYMSSFNGPTEFYELPWCQITLLWTVFLPLVIILILAMTVIIVICVYLKENIRNLKRMVFKGN